MPKKKTTKVVTVDSTDTINELLARVKVLEDKQNTVMESFEFAANELRPMFGMMHLALVFDAIHDRLTKK